MVCAVCLGSFRSVRPRYVRPSSRPLAHLRIAETATMGSYTTYREGGAGRQTDRVRESRRRRRRRHRWRRPGDLLVCFGNAPQTVVSPLSARPLPSHSFPSMSVRRRRRRRRRRDTCAVFHCSSAALRPRFVPNRKDDFRIFTFATLEKLSAQCQLDVYYLMRKRHRVVSFNCSSVARY